MPLLFIDTKLPVAGWQIEGCLSFEIEILPRFNFSSQETGNSLAI